MRPLRTQKLYLHFPDLLSFMEEPQQCLGTRVVTAVLLAREHANNFHLFKELLERVLPCQNLPWSPKSSEQALDEVVGQLLF